MAERDPYELLGIGRGATPEEIRAAFRRAVRESHPDTSSESGGPDVQSVLDAYRLLSDPATRAGYDASTGSSGRRIEVRRSGSRPFDSDWAPRPRCETCRGSGTVRDVRVCHACDGRTEITRLDGRVARVLRCKICLGRGRREALRRCADCSGSGVAADTG